MLELRSKAKVMLLDEAHGMAYVEAGVGAAVVFIHGSLCDFRYWKPQLDSMSGRYRIVTPSLSHYYPQLPSSGREPFTWTSHVQQVTAFLQRLSPRPIHLVGHSRGASIAYQAALKSPQLAASLTLVDPGGANERDAPDGSPPSGDARAVRARAVELIAQGSVDEGLKLFVDSTSCVGFWERSKPVFQDMARDNAATLALQIADELPVYRKSDADTLRCPVLLVDGVRSPAVYRDNADALHRWVLDSRRVTIQGASHGLTWSHAATFNAQLSAFLAGGGQ